MLIQAPKGTKDILPSEACLWQMLEKKFMDVSGNFGFREIRTPVFEYTDIFTRSVGETTDIVQKEMYTFKDKAGRSITLRPEGTAGIVRSYIENGLGSEPSPLKLAYGMTSYRYENVAKGRYREFNQFGAEVFGAKGPLIDAEMIKLVDVFFKDIGISGYGIEINSIGCGKCRPSYNLALKEYFGGYTDGLCDICSNRLGTNPLRILDCKEKSCRKVIENAPSILEMLCDECSTHFIKLQACLDSLGIKYAVNDRIVRGLDYYTKTVFEFVSENVGTQGTICGGGRYDDLVGQFNGNDVPAIGFALGVERLILQIEAEGAMPPCERRPLLFAASVGADAGMYSSRITCELRSKGIYCESDTMDRSLKAQMKYADRIGAKYVIVIGDEEIKNGCAVLKDMETGKTRAIKLEGLFDEITKAEG